MLKGLYEGNRLSTEDRRGVGDGRLTEVGQSLVKFAHTFTSGAALERTEGQGRI